MNLEPIDTSTTALLPCPFCGGSAEFVPYKSDGLTLKCTALGCVQRNQRTLRYGIDSLRASMTKHWNTRAPQWLPIDSAPRDGCVWAFNGEQGAMAWSEGDGWALWVWADELLSDVDPSPQQPTHWQPLPAPPEVPHD